MPDTVIFEDPTGEGAPIELEKFEVADDLDDSPLRHRKVPEADPHYVDLGMLYRFAQVEQARRTEAEGLVPLHIAELSPIVPSLALVGVFFWSVHRPDLMPIWAVCRRS